VNSNQTNSNQVNSSSNQIISTQTSSENSMDVDIQNKTKFIAQLEPIREESASTKDELDEEMDVQTNEINNQTNDNQKQMSSNEIDEDINFDDLDLLSSPDSDFDPINVLSWNKDVGLLPGTNLQFKLNEYDCLELITDKEADEIRKNFSNQFVDHYLPNNHANSKHHDQDTYSVCSTCGVKKLRTQFIRKGRFCSQDCATFQSSQLRNFKKSNILDIGSKNSLKNQRIKSTLDYEQDALFSNGYDVDDVKTKVKENYYHDKYFSWKQYLIETRSIAAPLKCFKTNQIYNAKPNYFKQGMKLEAIDPQHPSLFCVATVAEVVGHRLRIHLDKYSSMFDFWINCDSPFIFSVGFCAKTNRKLQPPKNYEQFDWSSYLQEEKARAAPKHCFYWNSVKPQSHITFGFKIGMKLEAVDKANSNLVCVATVIDILGDWLLIHFDGWDNSYDYWTEHTSPYIHPINWCKSKGKALTAPKDYPKSTFNWQDYLDETRSTGVPSSAFRVRPVNTFKPSMKLEVVDRRNPRYIRVATVIARGSYSIKINFDNWDEKYDFYIDDDSPDIHPINWCYQTNNYIEEPPPYDYDERSYYNRCETFGCSGKGSLRNANLLEHVSVDDCPYSEENMDYEVPDRLGDSSELSSESFDMNENESNFMLSNVPSPNSDSISLSTFNDKVNYSPAKLVKNGKLCNSYTLECFDMYNSDSERLSRSSSPNSDLNMLPIRQSIIDIKTSFLQMEEPLLHWDKNTRHLVSYVNTLKIEEVLEWNCDRVVEFVQSIPGCSEFASKFKEQSIDGESLLLLTQSDLSHILGIKLGPSIKLYNSILILRQNLSS